MNKDNLKKLIKVMKEKKYGFVMGILYIDTDDKMNKYLNKPKLITEEEANICGTAGCIAGHCYLISKQKVEYDLTEIGGDFLGLSDTQTVRLFVPNNHYASYKVGKKSKKFITRARAIKVLENLLETGEVDWSVR